MQAARLVVLLALVSGSVACAAAEPEGLLTAGEGDGDSDGEPTDDELTKPSTLLSVYVEAYQEDGVCTGSAPGFSGLEIEWQENSFGNLRARSWSSTRYFKEAEWAVDAMQSDAAETQYEEEAQAIANSLYMLMADLESVDCAIEVSDIETGEDYTRCLGECSVNADVGPIFELGEELVELTEQAKALADKARQG